MHAFTAFKRERERERERELFFIVLLKVTKITFEYIFLNQLFSIYVL
jgi:hypothetical protein